MRSFFHNSLSGEPAYSLYRKTLDRHLVPVGLTPETWPLKIANDNFGPTASIIQPPLLSLSHDNDDLIAYQRDRDLPSSQLVTRNIEGPEVIRYARKMGIIVTDSSGVLLPSAAFFLPYYEACCRGLIFCCRLPALEIWRRHIVEGTTNPFPPDNDEWPWVDCG